MKCISVIVLAILAIANVEAFSGSSFTGSQLSTSAANSGSMTMEYIPNGMSKAQWQKIKDAEKNKTQGKNLGKSGITTFKSRSFSDWQKSGGKNLFPVDPRSVKNPKDLPYMQRAGGSADDSDLGKKSGGFGGFFGKKKAAPEPVQEEAKPTNWWTL